MKSISSLPIIYEGYFLFSNPPSNADADQSSLDPLVPNNNLDSKEVTCLLVYQRYCDAVVMIFQVI